VKSREIPREFDPVCCGSSSSSKVIDLGVSRKRMYDFLLVLSSYFARISYRLLDIDNLAIISCFHRLALVWHPPSERAPFDINIINRPTPQKGTLNGLQIRRWQYGSIFIRLCVLGSQMCEILRNSERIWPRSSKVIDLGVNQKAHIRIPISH